MQKHGMALLRPVPPWRCTLQVGRAGVSRAAHPNAFPGRVLQPCRPQPDDDDGPCLCSELQHWIRRQSQEDELPDTSKLSLRPGQRTVSAPPAVPPSAAQQGDSSTQKEGCPALCILWVMMQEEQNLSWINPWLPN